MIETIIDGQKVKLYNNIFDWIIDEFDLDFLRESGSDKENIVRNIGEYFIECSNATNWPEVYETKIDNKENIEYNGIEYILVGGQDNTPVYIPDDGDSGDVYLVYFDDNKEGVYKAICKTEDDAIEWIHKKDDEE